MLSALVLVPVALFCLYMGDRWFLILLLAATVKTGDEWSTICGFPRDTWLSTCLSLTLAAVIALTAMEELSKALMVLADATALIWLFARRRPRPWLFPRELTFGVPYIGMAAVSLTWLRSDPAVGWVNVLFMLLVIWASDIGAYLVGRLVGGPKLAPSISPGKTRSGAVGGLVSAALAGLAVASVASQNPPVTRVLILSALLGVLAQAGDLLESGLKRRVGVKDSGTLIPGHGGVLDRLDAVLSVAPAAAILAWLAGRGEFLWR